MKTKFLLGITAIIFAISCEKEVNIYVPEDEPLVCKDTTIVIYRQDNIRVEQLETDKPTDSCANGQITTNVYRNDTIVYKDVRCRNYTCPDEWNYFHSVEEGGCDTVYNYDCMGNLKLKFPVCPKIVHDTIIKVVHDTLTVTERDTVTITERDTIKIVDNDTVTVTLPGDTVIITKEKYYARSKHSEDCNSGDSRDAVKRGLITEGESIEPYSENSINAPNKEGTLVKWKYLLEPKIIWFPEFEPSGLKSLCFKTGSINSQNIRMFVMHKDGFSEEVMSMKTNPVWDFIWYNHSTYKQVFDYNPSLSDIKSWDIIRWGILVENVGNAPVPDCDQFNPNCPWRNYEFNGDDFEWVTLIPLKK